MVRGRNKRNPAAGWLLSFCALASGCQNFLVPPDDTRPASYLSQIATPDGTCTVRRASAPDQDLATLRELTKQTPPVPSWSNMPAEDSSGVCAAPGSAGSGLPVPRELAKVVIPDYIIEPPDILLVEAIPNLPDQQPIQGEHLVRPDGTIGLGIYGSVFVAGLTLNQARDAIFDHLAKYIKKPVLKLNVDVLVYNSKIIYIIADGAGFGEQVVRLPYTGSETVLDAISQIGGLPAVSSKKKIWVARPAPDNSVQNLPVDWKGITQDGLVATNYQVFPGDRIYIQSDRLLALDGIVSKMVAPIERVLGVTFLGGQTIFRLQNMGRGVGVTGGTTGP